MTCIVGLQHKGKVYMGGDSAGTAGYDVSIRTDEKVFFNGPLLIGFTSSFRMGQILRYSLKVPPHPKGMSDMHYLVDVLMDAVRKCYKSKGYLRTNNDRESGGTFLMGYKGKLYEINDDFQVGIPSEKFASVGSGAEVAKGAMHVSYGFENEPEACVLSALSAAERFNAAVKGPFVVLCSKEYKEKTDAGS